MRTWFTQCVFLVAEVEICHITEFVMSMSINPSNCSRRLWRLVVRYKGGITKPSFWPTSIVQVPYPEPVAIIRIPIVRLSRYSYIHLTYCICVCSPLSFLDIEEQAELYLCLWWKLTHARSLRSAPSRSNLIDFWFMCSMRKYHNIAFRP